MLNAAGVLLRAMALLLSLQVTGVALFGALFGSLLGASRPVIRRRGLQLTLAAVLLLSANFALEPARLAGDLDGMSEPALYAMVLHSALAAAYALRLLALWLVVLALRQFALARNNGAAPAFAAVTVTVASFALTGHTATSEPWAPAAGLLALHLLIICFWLGALWPLRSVVRLERPAMAQRIVSHFSKLATLTVPLIALAGAGLAVLLLPGGSALLAPYGRLLLAKAGLFLVLLACAAANKWRLGPALAAGDERAIARFRRVVTLEYCLIGLVFLVTAFMTTFYSPAPA